MSTTHNVEDGRSCTCREKPEIGPSLENISVNVVVREAVEAKVYVIFKMVYMDKSCLENNHGENNIEKR